MKEARFDLGDILSVTTGKMLSLEGIGGIYEILNYLTGDNLMTHQLPRAMRAMRSEVLRQHECLAEVTGDEVTPENFKSWLAKQKKKYGDDLPLSEAPGLWDHKHPLQELAEMTGNQKDIIAVVTDRHGLTEKETK